MSKVVIQGNANGTGNFTIAAPNSNTDRTLNLPDVAGTVLTSGSNADFPAGSVVNFEIFQYSGDNESFTSSTYTDSEFVTTTYTPSSSSNKVLVIADISMMVYNNSAANAIGRFKISRNSGAAVSVPNALNGYDYGTSGILIVAASTLAWLDSPATTSAVTYTVQVSHVGGTQTRINYNGGTSRLLFFEVAA